MILEWGREKFSLQANSRGEIVPSKTSDPEKVPPDPVVVPRTTTRGRLILKGRFPFGASRPMEIPVFLADFPAPDKAEGARARLNNLGYMALSGPPTEALPGAMDAALHDGLNRFRFANRLPVAATTPTAVDTATQDRLADAHDNRTGPFERP